MELLDNDWLSDGGRRCPGDVIWDFLGLYGQASYTTAPAIEYNLKPPSWYQSVRFIIRRKAGKGKAVLAQIKVSSDDEASFLPPSRL